MTACEELNSPAKVDIFEGFRMADPQQEDCISDFEFHMITSAVDSLAGACMLPADELFHKGKLLPLSCPQKQVEFLDRLEKPSGSSSRQLDTKDSISHFPSVTSCKQTDSCSRTTKPSKWREVFAVLRRARSDSGRDQSFRDQGGSLVPLVRAQRTHRKQSCAPSPLRFISRRSLSIENRIVVRSPEAISCPSQKHDVRNPNTSHTKSTSMPTMASASQSPPVACHYRHPSGLSALHVTSPVYPNSSAVGRDWETPEDSSPDEWNSSDRHMDFTPSSKRNSWSPDLDTSLDLSFSRGGLRESSSSGDGSGSRIDRELYGAASASTPSGNKCGKTQEHLRALRTREIQRSPERFGSYSVRVTPVLNVPVYTGPTLRNSKSSKIYIASLRALLNFKKDKVGNMPSRPATAA